MEVKGFHCASFAEVKAGQVTDVYFVNTVKILRQLGKTERALAEVSLKGMPEDWKWGVLAGVEEAARLLEGLPVDVDALPEGTLFQPHQPVLTIEGRYVDYAVYETALLGVLCQASGIATKASRCRKAAGERLVLSFGARRMHPVLAPMIERNAFVGGCDGVAVVKSAELLGEQPKGTMPHALSLMLGSSTEAALAFHRLIDPEVKRVVLVDTFADEKMEALAAAQALGKELFAVRLDTPSSRRGNMVEILKEVRWELDLRGFRQVKLFVSGGLDEYKILRLNAVADAYGVGTAISNAPVVNFSFDIVEIEGRPVAKKGKLSGRKALFACGTCGRRSVLPAAEELRCPSCGEHGENLLQPLIRGGKLVRDLPAPQKIRQFVLEQLRNAPQLTATPNTAA